MDVNGDGLEDIVLARPNQGTWRIILNQGGSAAHPNGFYGAEITTTVKDVLGRPAHTFREFARDYAGHWKQ